MVSQKDHASKNKNKYILAVDDDSDIVTLIEHALKRHRLSIAALSDIRMPGMNGYEFVKKTKEIDKQVKVILMTAFDIHDKEFHNMLPDIKVDAFLQKPFHIQQLSDVIDKTSTRN